jgi:hypothetical protein
MQQASMALITLEMFCNRQSYATETLSDYVTIKYNSNGVQQWLATYDNNGFVRLRHIC